jgi:hypothetical protein
VTTTEGKIVAVKQAVPDGEGKPTHVVSLDPEKDIHAHAKHFTWRDWYSGNGDQKYEEGVTYPLVEGLHVSDPYVTVVPGIGTVVAVSMPVRDGPDGKVVGLLSASVPLLALGEWMKDAARLSDGGEILVLNRRRDGSRALLLRNGEIVEPKEGVSFAFADLEAALLGADEGTLPEHHPSEGQRYLAGYARTTQPLTGRTGRLDWVVLVRHERRQALGAIEELRERTWHYRLLTYVLTAALMAGLWAWLFWLMRRQDSLKA